MNSREQAFLIITKVFQGHTFAKDLLDDIPSESRPLIQELAYGTIRQKKALHHLALQLTKEGRLKLKLKEKALLYCALYQLFYLNHPIHAVTDEMVNIAKTHCPRPFAPFLNALLRNYSAIKPALPEGETTEQLSTRFSYPTFFVEALIQDYGKEEAVNILKAMNLPGKLMGRKIGEVPLACENLSADQLSSGGYYIQNRTPAYLMQELAQTTPQPKKILDLCASPGGKLLAAHDLYPKAALFANDLSEEKLQRLKENLKSFGVQAQLSFGPGEAYTEEKNFDLIILDVPCSNSGVLNKRPEARWRLDEKTLQQLEGLQEALLHHAVKLLAPGGKIWYLTCSILNQENLRTIEKLESLFQNIEYQKTILPTADGQDGGFGCSLSVR